MRVGAPPRGRLLCLLSPVPTVLRMISDVKGHDMKDHMVCNCALWWISMAVRTWLRLQFDLITNTFHFWKVGHSAHLCTLMWQNWEFTFLWDATPWDRLSRCELHGIACLQILRLWKLMVSSVPGVKIAWLVSCLPIPESLRGLNKKCRQPSPSVVAWTFDIQCDASQLSSLSCHSLWGMPFATIWLQ